VKVERDLLVVVTTGGRLYLWDLSGGHQPRALLKNEEICPLNRCHRFFPIYDLQYTEECFILLIIPLVDYVGMLKSSAFLFPFLPKGENW
jgi:hypothetical protein